MSIRKIDKPFAGERVVGLSPENATEAAQDWLRRPNLFPGRALTAAALAQRQAWQAGHVAMRGQDWLPGVIEGLQVSVSPVATGTGFATTRLLVSRGRGLAVSGEDVVLMRDMECLLSDVPVVAPAGFFSNGSGVGDATATGELREREVGDTLGALKPAALATLPAFGVLVLEPALSDVSGFDPLDPCDRCACEGTDDSAAFEDWRIADAVRLVWYLWPCEWRSLPTALPAAQHRNALATTIFAAEEALANDPDTGLPGMLPWEAAGVPIALVALDKAAQSVLWMDRASVVRRGGVARDARLQLAGNAALVSNSRLPALWQARIEQFAEQVAANGEPAPAPGVLAQQFGGKLPPVGLLPASALDPAKLSSGFFPSNFDIDAVPVPIEQLDLSVRDCAGLAALDVHANESVRVMVPVPLQSWEPRLLKKDVVDPEFQRTIDRYVLNRAREIGARQGLRNKIAMLEHARDGKMHPVEDWKLDPLAIEPETLSPWGAPPPGGGHRSQLAAGAHQHFFDGATEKLTPAKDEYLFAWVYIDPENPPRTIMLQWHGEGNWEHRAYWGENLIGWGTDGTVSRQRVGDLPLAGAWQMIKVPALKVGLEEKAIDGMAFTLFDGRAAWGLTGARTAAVWRKWFCNFLPLGANVQGNERWELLSANDLWAPLEAYGGVEPSLPEVVSQAEDGGGIPIGGGSATQARAVPSMGIAVNYTQSNTWRGHIINWGKTPPVYNKPAVGVDGDTLGMWVYLDELTPPKSLWVALMYQCDNGLGMMTAYWGENHGKELIETTPGWKTLVDQSVRAGALPMSGKWTQLEFPALSFIRYNDKDHTVLNGNAKLIALLVMAKDGALACSDVQQTPAAGGAAKVLWPQSLDADRQPVPAFTTWPALNAGVAVQNNLGWLTPTPASRIGTVRAYTGLINDPRIRRLSPHEQSQVLLRGLSGFSDYLRRRIDRADDITDFGFAHMQVDIHRIRQLTMSTSDASRLAISPALAAIAKSDSAFVVQSQIREYLDGIKAAAPAKVGLASPTPAPVPAPAPAPALKLSIAATSVSNLKLNTTARLIAVPRAAPQIVYSNPVVGVSEVRTTAIADRLRQPPSPEARDYALANRHRTISSLLSLLQEFLAEDSDTVPAMLDNFTLKGLASDPFLQGKASRLLTDFMVSGAIDQTLLAEVLKPPSLPVHPASSADSVDEQVYFTQAISLSDLTIAILRQLEARINIYHEALDACEDAIGTLDGQISGMRDRLNVTGDALAESRHDVSVARALLAEEEARIAAINERRAKVLAEEVKFIAYVRPRETDNLLATPTHSIDPGLLEAPVPACLREHPDVPEELIGMLRVVREAPANWFVRAPQILQKLDRVEHLVRLIDGSRARAVAGLAQPVLPAASAGRFAQSITRVATRQVEALAPRVTALHALDVSQFASITWQGIRAQAEQVVSFADLAEGQHGRSEISREAARELDNIRSIVACLHAEFSGIKPVLRLEWAETLSEFDAAPNLRNLASLPRWTEIDYVDRRQMQAYVDWLFTQIEPGQPQAVALINDVVRMCLLLASHAPIDRIIAGRMARPVTGVAIGTRIPLAALDASKMRVGMTALLYRGDALLARATVEDVGQLEISAHVVHTATARVDLGDDVRVHFDNNASVSISASASRSVFAH